MSKGRRKLITSTALKNQTVPFLTSSYEISRKSLKESILKTIKSMTEGGEAIAVDIMITGDSIAIMGGTELETTTEVGIRNMEVTTTRTGVTKTVVLVTLRRVQKSFQGNVQFLRPMGIVLFTSETFDIRPVEQKSSLVSTIQSY